MIVRHHIMKIEFQLSAQVANLDALRAHQLHNVLHAKVTVRDHHVIVRHHIMRMEFKLSAQVAHLDALRAHHQRTVRIV